MLKRIQYYIDYTSGRLPRYAPYRIDAYSLSCKYVMQYIKDAKYN
jgi:hypothetical protein